MSNTIYASGHDASASKHLSWIESRWVPHLFKLACHLRLADHGHTSWNSSALPWVFCVHFNHWPMPRAEGTLAEGLLYWQRQVWSFGPWRLGGMPRPFEPLALRVHFKTIGPQAFTTGSPRCALCIYFATARWMYTNTEGLQIACQLRLHVGVHETYGEDHNLYLDPDALLVACSLKLGVMILPQEQIRARIRVCKHCT